MDPIYDRNKMDAAQISPVDRIKGYEASLEDGGPDVGHVFGAPNEYESLTRFFGAQSDLIHNMLNGNKLDDKVLIVPEDVQEDVPDRDLQYLEDRGVLVQTPDRELYTTADDWKSARDIAGEGDRIHGYTSDYHGLKTHITGKVSLDFFGENTVHTFGFDTERDERENILKHNMLAQTGDTVRQLYKMATSDKNY